MFFLNSLRRFLLDLKSLISASSEITPYYKNFIKFTIKSKFSRESPFPPASQSMKSADTIHPCPNNQPRSKRAISSKLRSEPTLMASLPSLPTLLLSSPTLKHQSLAKKQMLSLLHTRLPKLLWDWSNQETSTIKSPMPSRKSVIPMKCLPLKVCFLMISKSTSSTATRSSSTRRLSNRKLTIKSSKSTTSSPLMFSSAVVTEKPNR